jgi:hypothetical protein
MRKGRDIIKEIEEDLNQDIYSEIILANHSEEDLIMSGLDLGYLSA